MLLLYSVLFQCAGSDVLLLFQSLQVMCSPAGCLLASRCCRWAARKKLGEEHLLKGGKIMGEELLSSNSEMLLPLGQRPARCAGADEVSASEGGRKLGA